MQDCPRSDNRALDAIETLVTTLMSLALAVVLVSVLLQIFFRDILSQPLSWTQELAQYAFVWMVFIGAGVGVRRGLHLKIDFLREKLPKVLRISAYVVSSLAALVLAATFIYCGVVVAARTWLHTSPAMSLPMGYVYFVFPISGFVLGIYIVEHMLQLTAKNDREER
jgi:TRAP-type transport system small permease protein